MLDNSNVTREITRLISQGSPQEAILAAVVRLFPGIDSRELSQAMQDAVEQAQRRAMRKH